MERTAWYLVPTTSNVTEQDQSQALTLDLSRVPLITYMQN